MTKSAALKKAQGLYGKTAAVSHQKGQVQPFHVGKIVMNLFFSVHATGDSWEECFAKIEADKAKGIIHV